jgi:excinuclease UvrABC nuclease subunit
MIIDLLVPAPTHREMFRRDRERFVPDRRGCYALATFSGVVLYVGLTEDIRRRMDEHLDNSEKTGETAFGRAVFFHWIETPDTYKVERTWINIHIQHEGSWPVLNKMYSPTST